MPTDSAVSWGILFVTMFILFIRGANIVIDAYEERYGGHKDEYDVW